MRSRAWVRDPGGRKRRASPPQPLILERQMPLKVIQARLYRFVLLVTFALLPAPQGSLWAQEIPMLRGTVVFADRTPVREATVTATTNSGEQARTKDFSRCPHHQEF